MSQPQLVLTIEDDVEGCHTVCTLKISKELQVNSGPMPRFALLGNDYIMASGKAYIDEMMGYWELSPEGLAMKFLRLAWYAAHDEHQQKNAPFDGDPFTTAEKAFK